MPGFVSRATDPLLAWEYSGETILKESPTLLSPTLIPLDANTPVSVRRPYTAPTWYYTQLVLKCQNATCIQVFYYCSV